MPILTPTLSPAAIAAPDAANVNTPSISGTRRADFIDHLCRNMFCWRKYNARQQRAYFKFVITDAENRRSRRRVTSGYIRQMALKKRPSREDGSLRSQPLGKRTFSCSKEHPCSIFCGRVIRPLAHNPLQFINLSRKIKRSHGADDGFPGYLDCFGVVG